MNCVKPLIYHSRELGGSTRSEYSVIKVEAYNGMNQYLSELSGTPVKTFEDIVDFNIENYGTEGAFPGDHPAFPTGQVGPSIVALTSLTNYRIFSTKF